MLWNIKEAMKLKMFFKKKNQLKIWHNTIFTFSIVSLRYTSSMISETIGFNMKTEFWSEIILVNAGLKEKGFFFSLIPFFHFFPLPGFTEPIYLGSGSN